MKTLIYINKVKIDSTLPAVNFSVGNAYSFAKAGWKTYLFVQKADKSFDTAHLYKWFALDTQFSLEIIALEERDLFGFRSNQFFYLEVYNWIIEQIKKNGKSFNLIISRDPGALPYLMKISKRTNIQTCYQPHNFYFDLKVHDNLNRKNSKKYHQLEKKYLNSACKVLCLQESQAKWYQKYLPDGKTEILSPGVIEYKNNLNRKAFRNRVIGYIGSLQQQKGLKTLLNAFSILKDKEFYFKAIIIGGRDKKELSDLKTLISELNLQDEIELTGWLNYENVMIYIKKMSLGILPLIDNFYNRYLTAPNKLFDYLSNNIPVLSSDLPSIRCFVNDKNIKFVEPENKEKLASAIMEIFTSQKLYSKYVEGALLAAQNNVWEHNINKLELP